MPGIAGVIDHGAPSDNSRLVATMLESMMHERFYESAICLVPELGVSAGVIAHPGSFAARGSNAGAEESVNLLVAGECFQDESILPLYDRLGDAFAGRLNGLFSGLIVDRRRQRTLLFNDRYGLERIYVHQTDAATYFASDAKALLRVLPDLRAFDDDAVAQFLAFNCVLRSQTLFRGVQCLEGASLWSFERGSCHKTRYFTPEEWTSQPALPAQTFDAEFEETFRRVLPRYARGESRLGVSLTGGLDTRMIMACLPALADSPICYTFSGMTGETLDDRLAARVARACTMEHRILRIGPDFLSDFGRHVDRTVYITDGCSGPLGAHEVYLNSQARELAPTRLTGNFGSEVFRGMSTFKPMGLSGDLIHGDFRSKVEAVAANEVHNAEPPATFAAFREIPWNMFGTLAAAKSQVSFRTPYLDNELVALACRTPSRQTSEAALRLVSDSRPALGRIPTDRALIVAGRGVGYMLKRLVSKVTFKLDYMHKEGMPNWLTPLDSAFGGLARIGVLGLHKYLPFRIWFRRELAKYVTDVLTDPQTARLPYWNQRMLGSIARDHIEGRRNYTREINAIVTLATADRLLVRGLRG